jgi:hypothetical protein
MRRTPSSSVKCSRSSSQERRKYGRPLGAVVAIGVRAAVPGADDHVRIPLRFAVGLDPGGLSLFQRNWVSSPSATASRR